jgi:hypothetical protein
MWDFFRNVSVAFIKPIYAEAFWTQFAPGSMRIKWIKQHKMEKSLFFTDFASAFEELNIEWCAKERKSKKRPTAAEDRKIWANLKGKVYSNNYRPKDAMMHTNATNLTTNLSENASSRKKLHPNNARVNSIDECVKFVAPYSAWWWRSEKS